MLDKKLIKIHQVLLGLFQEKYDFIIVCGIRLPELYKALLMSAEER